MPQNFQFYQSKPMDLSRSYSDLAAAEGAKAAAFTRPLMVAMEGLIQRKIQKDRLEAEKQRTLEGQAYATAENKRVWEQGAPERAADNARADRAASVNEANLGINQRTHAFAEATQASDAQAATDFMPGGEFERSQLGPVPGDYSTPQTMLQGTGPLAQPTMVGPSGGMMERILAAQTAQAAARETAKAKASEAAGQRSAFGGYLNDHVGRKTLTEAEARSAWNLRESGDEPGARAAAEESIKRNAVTAERTKAIKALGKGVPVGSDGGLADWIAGEKATIDPSAADSAERIERVRKAEKSGRIPTDEKPDRTREYGKIKVDLDRMTVGTPEFNRLVDEAVLNDPGFKGKDDLALISAILGGNAPMPTDGETGALWNKHFEEASNFVYRNKREMGLGTKSDLDGYGEWKAKQPPAPKPAGAVVEPPPTTPPAPAGAPAKEPTLDKGSADARSEIESKYGRRAFARVNGTYEKVKAETGDEAKARAAASHELDAVAAAPLGEDVLADLIKFYNRSDNPGAIELATHGSVANFKEWMSKQKGSARETLLRELKRWDDSGKKPSYTNTRDVQRTDSRDPRQSWWEKEDVPDEAVAALMEAFRKAEGMK